MIELSGRRALGYASEQVVPNGCRGAAERRESSGRADSCRGAGQRRESVRERRRAAVRSAGVRTPLASTAASEFLRDLGLFGVALLRLVFHLLGKLFTGVLVVAGLLLYLAGI